MGGRRFAAAWRRRYHDSRSPAFTGGGSDSHECYKQFPSPRVGCRCWLVQQCDRWTYQPSGPNSVFETASYQPCPRTVTWKRPTTCARGPSDSPPGRRRRTLRRSCFRASTSVPIPTRPMHCWPARDRLRLCPRRSSQRRRAGRKVPPAARHRAGRDRRLGHGSLGRVGSLATGAGGPPGRKRSALWPHDVAARDRSPPLWDREHRGGRLRCPTGACGDRAADEARRRRDDQQPAVARGRPGGLGPNSAPARRGAGGRQHVRRTRGVPAP